MYTHVVLFTLHNPDDAQVVADKIRSMRGRIPELKHIEVGIDDRPSSRSAQVCLITRFDDAAGLDVYATHPEHLAVLDFVRPRTQATIKADYGS